jgi:hypothetical protein
MDDSCLRVGDLGSGRDCIHLSRQAHNHSAYVLRAAVLAVLAAPMGVKALSELDLDLVVEVVEPWFVNVREGEQSRICLRRRPRVDSWRHGRNYLVYTLGPVGPRSPP